MLFSLGFLGTLLLNNFLKETYSSRKLELEKSIENLLDKNVDLGDYVGIRFLGISLGSSKINDKKNIDSEIKAKIKYESCYGANEKKYSKESKNFGCVL